MTGEPITAAGRRLVRPYYNGGSAVALADVLAIETQARMAERARIALAVGALPVHEFIDSYEPGTLWLAVDRDALLAAVRGEET